MSPGGKRHRPQCGKIAQSLTETEAALPRQIFPRAVAEMLISEFARVFLYTAAQQLAERVSIFLSE